MSVQYGNFNYVATPRHTANLFEALWSMIPTFFIIVRHKNHGLEGQSEAVGFTAYKYRIQHAQIYIGAAGPTVVCQAGPLWLGCGIISRR